MGRGGELEDIKYCKIEFILFIFFFFSNFKVLLIIR